MSESGSETSPLSAGTISIVEYVWISNPWQCLLRSKTRVLRHEVHSLSDVPHWNFDGSSTGQAATENSEVVLRPVALYLNPLLSDEQGVSAVGTSLSTDPHHHRHYLALCECTDASAEARPLPSNTRAAARTAFDEALVRQHLPWYGLEQEYTVMASDQVTPIAWHVGSKNNCIPKEQGLHYCGTKSLTHEGRQLAEKHMLLCLRAGLSVSGINAEVLPGQWEFQIGPCTGIDAADQLWVARYMLLRAAESMNLSVTFSPKPVLGDWNGSGCHANFSTADMRQAVTGLDHIHRVVDALRQDHRRAMLHSEHMYGQENHRRLTGKHETSSVDTFTSGVADRSASVRIPSQTFVDKGGYFEDRRPAANADPYTVTSYLFSMFLASGAV